MVSRQKLSETLNNSIKDDLHNEDVWFEEAKLLDDHIEGILRKWDSIEDDIWAKVIVMEKNHMVAKAFIRTPVLTVNAGRIPFDGEIIGLCGFNNTQRDASTERVLHMVKEGCRLKMDDGGNIIIKRLCGDKIFCKGVSGGCTFEIPIGKPQILFDMRKFQSIMDKEGRKDKPDWGKVRKQAISSVSFVHGASPVLEQPVWLLVINIVALDLLRIRFGNRVDSEMKYSPVSDSAGQAEEKSETLKTLPKSSGLVPPFVEESSDYQMPGHPITWHRVEFSSGKEALI